jgi:hypothetical protein
LITGATNCLAHVFRSSYFAVEVIFSAATRHMKMLRDARMAGPVKLRCSVDPCRQRPDWAVRVAFGQCIGDRIPLGDMHVEPFLAYDAPTRTRISCRHQVPHCNNLQTVWGALWPRPSGREDKRTALNIQRAPSAPSTTFRRYGVKLVNRIRKLMPLEYHAILEEQKAGPEEKNVA